jgi:ABC-type Zn uptake system ZnuABC Zn-binding protein ZnuA
MMGRTTGRRAALRGIGAMGVTALLAACGHGKDSTATGASTSASGTGGATNRLTVAATTTQIQDFVQNVGGSLVKVVGILKPNVDPHDYEPTVDDANAIARASVIFTHGVGLDAWMDKTIKNANTKAPVVVTTAGVPLLKGDESEPEGDPHLWFDPTLVKMMVNTIAAGLVQVDGANITAYMQNVAAYNAQLDQMDQQVRDIFDQVPQAQRKLVTNHDAFRYLARHYNLTIVGAVIPSIADTAEPSAKTINDLIATINREQVKAIFVESSANPKVARQVAQETGVTIVDTLYGDTLGAPGSTADTYLTMMVSDATTITNAIK